MKKLVKNDTFCLVAALLLLVGAVGFVGYALVAGPELIRQLTTLPPLPPLR